MELDERIEALEKEMASIKGNLRTTLEQIRDAISQGARPAPGPSTVEGQVRTEDADQKSTSRATSRRPRVAQKPGTERLRVPEGGAPADDAVPEHVEPASSRAAGLPSPTADLSPYLERKLADLPLHELEAIMDIYVKMGYLPEHTKRLMERILHPTISRPSRDRRGISLWDCIAALSVDDGILTE